MDMSKVFHGILWILALTTDSFVVSFAYGMEKIKLSFLMVVGMNLIMSCLLGMAVLTGNFLSCFLSKKQFIYFSSEEYLVDADSSSYIITKHQYIQHVT